MKFLNVSAANNVRTLEVVEFSEVLTCELGARSN